MHVLEGVLEWQWRRLWLFSVLILLQVHLLRLFTPVFTEAYTVPRVHIEGHSCCWVAEPGLQVRFTWPTAEVLFMWQGCSQGIGRAKITSRILCDLLATRADSDEAGTSPDIILWVFSSSRGAGMSCMEVPGKYKVPGVLRSPGRCWEWSRRHQRVSVGCSERSWHSLGENCHLPA